MVHKPAWFTDGRVFVSYAPTVGINKDGQELYVVDPQTGQRTDVIDDQLAVDVESLTSGGETETARWVDNSELTERMVAVPVYFDNRSIEDFEATMQRPEMRGFDTMTIGELIDKQWIVALSGHGSPSADMRTGEIPYVKVSDIRAGQININPTNRVSEVVAERYWKGQESGLRAWDLISPIRTSKNIGEFAVLMPGQERIVLTKEMLILRAGDAAPFDTFFLLWAMTLKAVRRQWDRIVFMQTNREDVGKRYREIRIPVSSDQTLTMNVSAPFRKYYEGSHRLRQDFIEYLASDEKHYIFMATAEAAAPETPVEDITEVKPDINA